MKKVVFVLICIIFITIWFGSKQIVTFSSPSNVDSFPIPSTAKEVDSVAKNPNIIRYQKYKYSGADEINSINKKYLTAIKKAGWTELKDEQMGAARFFQKDKVKVSLITHDNYISVAEMKH
ncbi:hypothetical protein [Bacillus sp. JJ722]|uniref:hypothetical protein n=1 Tax=Bacillus sp. JJ722 TaxID=3122973 RepID=UPI002FFD754C